MNLNILEGVVLDEKTEFTIHDLCRACSSTEDWIIELVEEGAIEPIGRQRVRAQSSQWRFPASSLQRVQIAMRLQRDLDINLSGIALALELLNDIETLKSRLRFYE
jgi:chaperone modulatory protein CbpM